MSIGKLQNVKLNEKLYTQKNNPLINEIICKYLIRRNITYYKVILFGNTRIYRIEYSYYLNEQEYDLFIIKGEYITIIIYIFLE